MTVVIPAATLVVMRDRPGLPPELLMVERATAMAFAGGATVFPGGRVDPADHLLAQSLGGADPDDGAGRIAAIRETIEEAGLPVGLTTMPTPSDLRRLRAALHDGTPFGAALQAIGAALDPAQLVPFARWRPAFVERRLFDTRFYLARLPVDAPVPEVDGTENVRLWWSSARDVLDRAADGDLTIIFPTKRNLERLARFASFDAAAADARAMPVRTITPWLAIRDGEEHLCIPDDLGYPVTSERRADVRRG